jgi:hypothetical protein
MQKTSTTIAFVALALSGAFCLFAQPAPSADGKVPPPKAPRVRASPHETVSTVIGGRGGPRVTITYGRPYSKNSKTGEVRKVWGSLVPHGPAYRLGADEATLLVTPVALDIQGKTIPAGAYTLYLVPTDAGAKLAFSSHIGEWGIPVNETKDVARFDLKKETLTTNVDQLTIAVENDQATTGGGVIKIAWEETQFSLPFAVKK